MATAEIAVANVELTLNEPCEPSPDSSSNTAVNESEMAVNESEMQVFVKEHLLSLMRPVNFSIQDIFEQLKNLRDDVWSRHKKVDESSRQLERHSSHVETFTRDLTSLNKKTGKIETAFAQMLEIQSKAQRERAEAVCEKLDNEMQKLFARVQELEGARTVSEGSIIKLQSGVGELASFTKRMDTDVVDLQKKLEDVNFCNLGMSQRLEQTKVRLDDASQNVQKLLECTSHHQEEIKVNHSRSSRAIQNLEERTVVACFDIEAHGRRLSHLEGELEKIWKEVGSVESANAIADENQKKMHNEMLEFQKLDTRTAIRELGKTIHEVDARLKEVAQGASDMVKTKLAELSEGVTTNRKTAVDNAACISKVGGNLLKIEYRVDGAEHKIADLEEKKDLLRQDVKSAEVQIKTLRFDQQTSATAIEEHGRELEKANSRVYGCEKGLENADKGIKQLTSDITSINDKMSRTSNHLNLAHEYLNGMTKGIADAQKHVSSGMDGMLPMKEQQLSLPGLPGAIPRRPLTAFT